MCSVNQNTVYSSISYSNKRLYLAIQHTVHVYGIVLLSLRSRREWVPARTSIPNASAKSRSGREKNGEESS